MCFVNVTYLIICYKHNKTTFHNNVKQKTLFLLYNINDSQYMIDFLNYRIDLDFVQTALHLGRLQWNLNGISC